MKKIIIIGDSIVYGKGDTLGGWAQRLRSDLDRRFYKEHPDGLYLGGIINLGTNGGTSTDLLQGFENELDSRVGGEMVVVIGIGVNDTQWLNDEKHNRVEIAETVSNMFRLIEAAKKYTDKVFVLGLLPVEEVKVDPIPWRPGNSYLNREITRYDKAIKETTKDAGATYISLVNGASRASYMETMIRDGVHPNNEGHQYIAKVVKEALKKEGIEI